MKKKEYNFRDVLVVLLLLVIGILTSLSIIWVMTNQDSESEPEEEQEVLEDFTLEEFKAASDIQPFELIEHSTIDDCWIAYSRDLYEVTNIIDQIPEVSISDCGKPISTSLSEKSFQIIDPYNVGEIPPGVEFDTNETEIQN